MNYELISETAPVARKVYRCIWCGEAIERGLKHVHEVSRYEDFQDQRWHNECWEASARWFRSGEWEFGIGEFKRGTVDIR